MIGAISTPTVIPALASSAVTACSVSSITSDSFCAPVPFCTPDAAYFCSTSITAD